MGGQYDHNLSCMSTPKRSVPFYGTMGCDEIIVYRFNSKDKSVPLFVSTRDNIRIYMSRLVISSMMPKDIQKL
jgi:hypothetical protein